MPEEDVKLMLEAAMMAPSARNTRPWEFFVVEDQGLKSKLRYAHPFAAMLDTASLAIVVCGRPEAQTGRVAGYWPLDCGAAVENLLLQAAALGYGTCWCGCWPSPRLSKIQELLNTQSLPVALIAVGVPDENPPARGFYESSTRMIGPRTGIASSVSATAGTRLYFRHTYSPLRSLLCGNPFGA